MRKILIAVMVLLLIPACALAYTQDNAPIFVNDVRTAFFGADNQYLPAVSENGLTYVPFVPAVEGLSLDAALGEDGGVYISGVRAAFFGKDGAYLPPLDVGGVVYVPLVALADCVGVQCTEKDGAYYLYTNEFAQAASPTAVPTAAPTAAPEYSRVPIGTYNFSDYFSATVQTEDKSYSTETSTQYFDYLAYAVDIECYPITGYQHDKVYFTVTCTNNLSMYFGSQVTFSGWMPGSGMYRDTQTFNKRLVNSKSTIDGIKARMNERTTVILSTTSGLVGKPMLTSASGMMLLPYEEAMIANDALAESARNLAKNGSINSALEIAGDLENVQYPDADALSKELLALKTQGENERKEKAYQSALAQLAKEDYAGAISGFSKLGKYKDSEARLSEAREAKQTRDYQSAAEYVSAGEYENAIALYEALGEYRDSAALANSARDAILDRDYAAVIATLDDGAQLTERQLAALDALYGLTKKEYSAAPDAMRQKMLATAGEARTAGRLEFALKLCTMLAEGGYAPAQAVLAEYTAAFENAFEPDYQRALALYAEKKYDTAIVLFEKVGAYKDAPEMLSAYQKTKAAYDAAMKLEQEGSYNKAYSAFQALADFADSAQRAACCYVNSGEFADLVVSHSGQQFFCVETYQPNKNEYSVMNYVNIVTGQIMKIQAIIGTNMFAKDTACVVRWSKETDNWIRMLIFPDGNIIEPEWYHVLRGSTPDAQYITVEYSDGILRLLYPDGQPALAADSAYEFVCIYPEGYLGVKRADGTYTLISSDAVELPLREESPISLLRDISTGALYYYCTTEKGCKLCDISGKVLLKDKVPINNSSVGSLYKGVIEVRDVKSNKLEFYDVTTGKKVSITKYDYMYGFNASGLAIVKKGKTFGVINTKNKLIIPFKASSYEGIKVSPSGLILTKISSASNKNLYTYTFYDINGKKLKEVKPKTGYVAFDIENDFASVYVEENKKKVSYFITPSGATKLPNIIGLTSTDKGKLITPELFLVYDGSKSNQIRMYNMQGLRLNKSMELTHAEKVSDAYVLFTGKNITCVTDRAGGNLRTIADFAYEVHSPMRDGHCVLYCPKTVNKTTKGYLHIFDADMNRVILTPPEK